MRMAALQFATADRAAFISITQVGMRRKQHQFGQLLSKLQSQWIRETPHEHRCLSLDVLV